ncbi:MAG TPA: septum formation initiator family protein, partial [Bryobacteraceae bacterium]|nr:septum formation initiator family protein [Bryobacteraceae bacterium]
VAALVETYGYLTLRRPQGIPALHGKWNEIRKMEEENAALQRENDYRRKRIDKLRDNTSEQELEIRKKLKLLRPGETSFILPEQPKPGSAAAPAHDDSKAPSPPPNQD